MSEHELPQSASRNADYFGTLLSALDLKLFPLIRDEGDDQAQKFLEKMSRAPGCRRNGAADLDEETSALLEKTRQTVRAHLDQLLTESSGRHELMLFDRVQAVFSLSDTELSVLLICAASAADPFYRTIYDYLQDTRHGCPTAELIFSLCLPEGLERLASLPLLQSGHTLIDAHLIEVFPENAGTELQQAYRLGDGMLECLSGVWKAAVYGNSAELLPEPREEETLQKLPLVSCREDGSTPVYSLYGLDLREQERAAQDLAARMGKALLRLKISEEMEKECVLRLLGYALRDAALLNAVLLLDGMDGCMVPGDVFPEAYAIPILTSEVPVIFNTRQALIFSTDPSLHQRAILRIACEMQTGSQRLAVWQRELKPFLMGSEGEPDEAALGQLSGQFVLTSGQIAAAVAAARGFALSAQRGITIADLYHGARLCSLHHLDDLARKMPPRYNRHDLILPDAQKEQLDELIHMAKNRSLVLDDWGVGKKLTSGRGISALFTGPPGTGKTLSAQVIGGELGLDIYRIDLSSVVSKYIGETEKNLEKIFNEAQNSNVILFFDEADALFGKRSDVSDAHDRYANIEVGYLLQRIETYNGLAILATNLGANLDEAFTRRLHFIIDFPFPDEATRLRLWKMLIPPQVKQEADLGLSELACDYRIAGGNIRNAIVNGIFTSAEEQHPLCQADLVHGVRREFQKMGRVFKE